MKEIIVKFFGTDEEWKDLSKLIDKTLKDKGELKLASRVDETGYQNEIWQIGKNEPGVEVIKK